MYPNTFFENIVVSLDLARKLKENNIAYPTLFYWRVWKDGYSDCVIGIYEYDKDRSEIKEKIPTYDAATLLEELPGSIKYDNKYFDLAVYKIIFPKYKVQYENREDKKIEILEDFWEDSLADALARMLLWLKNR